MPSFLRRKRRLRRQRLSMQPRRPPTSAQDLKNLLQDRYHRRCVRAGAAATPTQAKGHALFNNILNRPTPFPAPRFGSGSGSGVMPPPQQQGVQQKLFGVTSQPPQPFPVPQPYPVAPKRRRNFQNLAGKLNAGRVRVRLNIDFCCTITIANRAEHIPRAGYYALGESDTVVSAHGRSEFLSDVLPLRG